MMDPIVELKTRAEILQRSLQQYWQLNLPPNSQELAQQVQLGDAVSLEAESLRRLRKLAQWSKANDAELVAALPNIRRKHCLAVVARESGFGSWDHACRVLRGEPNEADYGVLLYGRKAGGALNCWCSAYEEAKQVLKASAASDSGVQQYLLAYKRQFFLCEGAFVASLGLEPEDPDWLAIGWDWVCPAEPAARRRLYAKRLDALRKGL